MTTASTSTHASTKTSRQWITWIAIWAILVNALMPAIAHATMSRSAPLALGEICSASASKVERPITPNKRNSSKQSGQTTQLPHSHCAYCLSLTGTDGWMSTAVTPRLPSGSTTLVLSLPLFSFHLVEPWRTPLSRAPPTFASFFSPAH